MWILATGLSVMTGLLLVGQTLGGTLNDEFNVPMEYVQYEPSDLLIGRGHTDEFSVLFRYMPDPEGGHPTARTLTVSDDQDYLFQGVIADDPLTFDEFLRFEILSDVVRGLADQGGWTWDVPLPVRVPQLGSGWLVVSGLLWAVAYSLTWATKD